LQRVEITGSAIKRIDAETSVPVTVIRVDDLKKQGITSVQDVISRLSASTSTQVTSTVVGAGTGGASFADLRGIGSDKTLILLNGRRLANNAISGSSTDVNTIPFAALERIEVLRDGASALYGTDAIGGVINFITKKSYTAGEISINYEQPEASGGKSRGVNGAVGFGDLDTDGWNVLGVIDYQKQDRINSQQRAFGSRGYLPEHGVDGTSGTTFPANYTQQQGENFFSANPTFPGCAPVGNGGSINTGASATNCRYDPTPYQDLIPSAEKYSVFAKGSLKLGSDSVLSAEYFLGSNTVYSVIGPVPQTGLTMNPSSPFFPGAGITPAPTNFTIDPTQPIGVNWRSTAAGGRGDKNENTSQRFVLNLQGSAAGWDYDVAGTYNENKVVQSLVLGYNNDDKIASGIADGILNPFGDQTAAGAEYLANAALRGELQSAKGKVTSIDGKVSREIGDWFGAGRPAAIAIGAEFRREQFSDVINGDVAGQAASTGVDPAGSVSEKSRNISAFYSELNVPFLKSLEGTLAVRYDKYSDFGNTTNPKVGLRFQPIPEFLARATYSTGFRAPSLYELYTPNALTFTANAYDDPVQCPGGVPIKGANPNVACGQQFLAQVGGNANLQPEKAKNFTLGFVIEPVRDLTVGLDFWWIRLKNSIAAFPETAIFGDPTKYANRFHRAPDGSLTPDGDDPGYIVTTLDNLGETHTNGIDVSANYRYRLGGGDNVSVNFLGTYVDKFEYQREIDGPYFQNVGAFVDAGVIFRWKHSITVAYNAPNWSAGVTNRYETGYTDQNDPANVSDPKFYDSVGSYSLWDVFGTYTFNKAITLTLGVHNLLDTDPPFSNQGSTFQAGYDPRYTDPTGRSYYAKLTYAFK
jgi:iron complex outermembrane receptor protein